MLGTALSPGFVVASLMALTHVALAGEIIPCALGSGESNGCSYCEDDKAIKTGPWFKATKVASFHMENAAAQVGGGYDVWWNIAKPDEGCRVLITEPYNTDKGALNGKLSGNVVLSAAHGGCYFAHVGSRGVSVGFCCGTGDCQEAGAIPGGKKKRELTLPSSRIARGLQSSHSESDTNNVKRDVSTLEARRCWGGVCDDPPPPPKPAVTCSKAKKIGDTYTKAGTQQVDGNTLTCNGGQSCSLSPSMSVMASTSLSNEKSTTHTDGQGVQVSMTAGFMLIGPTATVTTGYSKDWSDSISNSMGLSKTDTVTKTVALSIGLTPGVDFNLWFTPTLRCQSYEITCNDVKQTLEKCEPVLDGSGNPTGDHGVMTVA
ncbi:hypothetical protein CC78DRAFT_530184 [Lojkania enalia]|uniref:Uncharacterized protein n=1 Tax=Lojkania enalia TaxID=147567 RepID=A0A9P4KI46_9PLEO|nr:hypothetical protein CC78DRAFT_530184 [Didymosphaeria enalia]